MTRVFIVCAPSILILVVCARLVHVEGELYRRGFHETTSKGLVMRLVQGDRTVAARTSPNQPGEAKADTVQQDPIEVAGSPSTRSQDSVANSTLQQESSTRGSVDPSQAPKHEGKPPAVVGAPEVPPVATPVSNPKPQWAVDPISWKDPRKLTPDQEARIGKALHEVILRRHRVLEQGAEQAFLNHLYGLSAVLNKERIELSFYLLDSDQIIAFSHLGGYVYLSRRLARLVPQDVELEFIIAHEMGHLEKRHGVEKVARDVGAMGVPPDQPGLVQRLYHQIAAGYEAAQEFEADALACQRLMKLGCSPCGVLSFLRRLENFEVRNSRAGPMQPETPLDAEVQAVDRHWRTHPAVPLRLARLQELTDAAPAKSSR